MVEVADSLFIDRGVDVNFTATVPAASPNAVVLTYSVPANTKAILHAIFLLIQATVAVGQASINVSLNRSGVLYPIARVYSTVAPPAFLVTNLPYNIPLQAGDILEVSRVNGQPAATNIQICTLVISEVDE
jgi:hypothetical protein